MDYLLKLMGLVISFAIFLTVKTILIAPIFHDAF